MEQILIYPQGGDGYNPFAGNLPKGLTPNIRREGVIALLGKPANQGFDAARNESWERYDFQAYSLHLTYRSGECGIFILRIMKPQQ